MRAAAYLRVSTDTQAGHGLGLDGLDSREALPDAVAEVRAGRAAGLVVYRLDRLARDLILQETLLAEIAAAGGQVFSTMPGEQAVIEDDPDDPSRRLIRQVLGAVAEYERSLIRLRLRNGRRRKAERGRVRLRLTAAGLAR